MILVDMIFSHFHFGDCFHIYQDNQFSPGITSSLSFSFYEKYFMPMLCLSSKNLKVVLFL